MVILDGYCHFYRILHLVLEGLSNLVMYPPSEPTLALDPAMLMDSTLPDEEGSEYEYEYDENETEVRLNLQGLIAILSLCISHSYLP